MLPGDVRSAWDFPCKCLTGLDFHKKETTLKVMLLTQGFFSCNLQRNAKESC